MTSSSVSLSLTEWSSISAATPASPLMNVFLKDPATRELAQELTSARMLEIRELREGLSLASTSYVGRITLGDVEITIHPKIRGTPLVSLLRYAYGLRDLHITTMSTYEGEDQSLQDILISQLIEEAGELLARGLQRRYVCTKEQLSSPRGKIDLQSIVKQGGGIKATVPCIFYPRLEDSLINQVLLGGLRLAARLTNNTFLRVDLYRLAGLFQESISAIRLDFHLLKKVHQEIDRLTAAYRPAITVIEMLLAGEGISLDEDRKGIQLPGFLFNMNLFFQALLSRFLNEHLEGYEMRDQYTIKGMMRYHPSYNPRGRRAPTPRPDYVILQGGRVVAILDAKYRDLWEHDLPAHWLYQLAIYALSQPGGINATILYPTVQNEAQEARITLSEPVFGTGRASVLLRPVNLLYLEQLITRDETASTERERTAFAKRLVFGEGK